MATAANSQPTRLSTTVIVLSILAMIVLMTIPLLLVQDSEFGGSDDAGSEAVGEIAPDYDSSWITNVWEPPGGETESMLFALQAIAGGILIGYFFGYKRGQRSARQPKESDDTTLPQEGVFHHGDTDNTEV